MTLPRSNAAIDQNFVPTLIGVSTADGKTPVAIEVDPLTGLLQVNSGSGGAAASLYTGRVTVNTTQVQISSVSHSLSNGIIVKSLSTNAANIAIGLTGVTATTGDILEPGEVRGYAVSDLNLLYSISPTSTTDIITYSAN